MNQIVKIGEDAKSLLYDMRAEQAIDMLLSASEYINNTSTLPEKELVDWYAYCALSVKEARLPTEITLSDREYLDSSAEEIENIQRELDKIFKKFISWFSEIEALQNTPRINRSLRNPRSKAPQNRLYELEANLEKQLDSGLSDTEWESVVLLIKEQFDYISGWRVFSGSRYSIWHEVKPGYYADYVKHILNKCDFEPLISDINSLVAKAVRTESKREEIRSNFLPYSNKSSLIGSTIDQAINNFSGFREHYEDS